MFEKGTSDSHLQIVRLSIVEISTSGGGKIGEDYSHMLAMMSLSQGCDSSAALT